MLALIEELALRQTTELDWLGASIELTYGLTRRAFATEPVVANEEVLESSSRATST